jgi:hypothetical protein
MFQYAHGVSLAERFNTPLCINTEFYNSYHRPFLLDKFPITHKDHHRCIDPWIREKEFTYNKVDQSHGTLYGYWQSEKYFKDVSEQIRKEFALPIKKNDAVAVHVRRGDYLKLQHIYQVTPLWYYKEATKKYEGREFYVFSDDIQWCKDHLELNGDVVFTQGDEFEQLALMAGCQSHVIANSTFSWWGAWLSGANDVTVPMPWFTNNLDARDLIPDTWRSFQLTH